MNLLTDYEWLTIAAFFWNGSKLHKNKTLHYKLCITLYIYNTLSRLQ